tara:strand:+ start:4001 stop:4465 length:465 start_codon:yes stop_codon:yes gene_type:complete
MGNEHAKIQARTRQLTEAVDNQFRALVELEEYRQNFEEIREKLHVLNEVHSKTVAQKNALQEQLNQAVKTRDALKWFVNNLASEIHDLVLPELTDSALDTLVEQFDQYCQSESHKANIELVKHVYSVKSPTLEKESPTPERKEPESVKTKIKTK